MNADTIIEADQKADMVIQAGSDEEKKRSILAGIKEPDADQNKSQRRHFPNKTSSDIFFCGVPPKDHVASKDYAASENGADHDDQNISEKRHFHVMSEDFISNDSADRDEQVESTEIEGDNADEQVESTEIEGDNADQHFHLPSEDFITSGDKADQEEQVESTESEAGDVDHEKTQRRHFHYKTSSNIFFNPNGMHH